VGLEAARDQFFNEIPETSIEARATPNLSARWPTANPSDYGPWIWSRINPTVDHAHVDFKSMATIDLDEREREDKFKHSKLAHYIGV
jgi:hypothetical protein